MKASHILGTVTIVAIIGGTIYAIKKSKDLKKAEGETISLEEARDIVARRGNTENNFKSGPKGESVHLVVEPESVGVTHDGRLIKRVTVEPLDTDGVKTSFEVQPYKDEPYIPEEDEDEDDLEEEIIEIYPEEHGRPWAENMTEEDKVLRHDPNSLDALNQYKKMELAEWAINEENYQTLDRLYDFPFQPQNDGDEMLRTQIIDYRAQFFGFNSKWTKDVTFADVIMHYARAAQFNCDESVRYWADYFLDFTDFYYAYSSGTIDEELKQLNSHTHFNEERQTFGLFGLTRESMDQAIKIAHRNVDRSVTYEIEFNEFLKSFI